jgi:hypothetical protein
MNDGLHDFHVFLLQEVIARTSVDVDPTSRLSKFTEVVSEILSDAGEITGIDLAFRKSRGIEVTGYSVEERDDSRELNLFLSIFDESETSTTLSKKEMEAALSRLEEFVSRSKSGWGDSISETDEVFELAGMIREDWTYFDECRFFVLTNKRFGHGSISPINLDGKDVSINIWDLERLFRVSSSGLARENIRVDVLKRMGEPLRCLRGPSHPDHEVYLAIFPGGFLAELYEDFGARLLERNVRAFLQTKGGVNKGIRNTILHEPERFMAYNNGVSATASGVTVIRDADGDLSIVEINDIQIVNGGQTTASLYSAMKKDKVDLTGISVQAKISVVLPEIIDDLVPYISQYSNTQNKVTAADFSANDPFHVKLEEFSRTVWAPSRDGIQVQTHWFYERARGQYADELARCSTLAQKKKFKLSSPQNQKFTKTDLAKFEHSWEQKPHLVSLGAEKNFRHFAIGLSDRALSPTQEVFQRIVAKAILFKSTDRIVAEENFGGYKANIVAYTISKLVHDTRGCIDLDQIWLKQGITGALSEAIRDLSRLVAPVLMTPRGRSRHVGEWTKKIDCWTVVKDINWSVPKELERELIKLRGDSIRDQNFIPNGELISQEESDAIEFCLQFSADTWKRLANWGKETKNLAPFQNGIAYGIGNAISNPAKRKPSVKQALQGIKIMSAARELGFDA